MPPNLLLITDDQHRFDFYEGGPVAALRTPALARLMAEGTTLTNAYSACPLCVPTRFTWYYGLRASQANGAWGDVDTEWPRHLPSVAHALQRAGYATAVIGKIHSHSGLHAVDLTAERAGIQARGFDHVLETAGKSMLQYHDCDYTRYLAAQGLLEKVRGRLRTQGAHHTEVFPGDGEQTMDAFIGRRARAWLEAYDGRKPFFLHASFCDPHFPYDPPPDLAARYRPEDMPVPAGLDDAEAIASHQRIAAGYCALIEHVDREIGRLLAVLERRGWAEETVVVFTTDHGDMMGERGAYGKHQPYDPSARTPVVVRFPGRVPAGVVRDGPAESIDLPAALLEAASLGDEPATYLPTSPARSWWQYVTGKADHHRDYAYSEMGPWKMVVDRDWKFIHRAEGPDELYDRTKDPGETENLAGRKEQGPRIQRMQRRLIESLSQNIAPPSLTTVLTALLLATLTVLLPACCHPKWSQEPPSQKGFLTPLWVTFPQQDNRPLRGGLRPTARQEGIL